jgi:eukaryotic-like serine/threonine-protein kinase
VGVSLGQGSAHDYDPLGTGGEHPEQTSFAVDANPTTAWSTENYNGGDLNKAGVGIYIDAAPAPVGRQLRLTTPTPGFSAEIYGARTGPPADVPDPRWVKLAASASVRTHQRFALNTHGRRYRFYLVWITKLPPGKTRAQIAEIALYRARAG